MQGMGRILIAGAVWLCACTQALAADAAKFDELIRQMEQGERVFYNAEDANMYLQQLRQVLPPQDDLRQRRLQREACPVEFLTNPQAGVDFAGKFIADPALASDHLTLSYFYLCRASYLVALGESARQQEDLLQALALANSSEDALAQANVLSAQADVFSIRGEHAEALVRLFKAYDLFQKANNRQGTGLTLENIASAFRRMAEFDKAIEYLETSEREFIAPNDSYRQAFVLQQKAFVYGEMGKTPQARALMQQVRQIYLDIGDTRYAVATLIDLLWISNLEQKYAESMELISQIEQESAQLRRQDPKFRSFNHSIYQLFQAEALAEYGRIPQGLAKFAEAARVLEAEQNPRYLLMLYQAWSRAEAKAGNYAQAYQKLELAGQLQDKLNSQAKQQREALLRYQFDTELQAQNNIRLQAENQLTGQQLATLEAAQRWQYIAIGLFVVLALIALVYAISQIQRNKRLHKLAMTDELTQVGNRRAILAYCEHIQLQARHQQHWCLLIVDIDYFKQCNDQYGHEAGDEVLAAVAGALQATLAGVGRIGRSGGEEFLVVLPETTEVRAAEIAERLRQVVANLQFARYSQIRVTISLGLTQAGRHEQVREIIARADNALYRAKANGRDQVVSL